MKNHILIQAMLLIGFKKKIQTTKIKQKIIKYQNHNIQVKYV